MNLLLVEPDEVLAGVARLRDRRAAHARDVLRVQAGATLRAGVLRGRRGTGVVRAVDDAEVVVELDLTDPPDARPRVDIALALPRPKALRRILQTAAAMGIGRIDLVNAWRVDKAYFSSPAVAPDALRRELVLGCEQGVTTWLPDVAVHPRLMPYLDELPAAGADDRARVVLHPRAPAWIEAVAAPQSRLLAAIGPEGGWIQRELDTLIERGFAAASLGTAVLRTETAVTTLLAQLALLHRLPGP